MVLQKLADWRPGGERETLKIIPDDSPWSLHLTGDHADAFSCQAWELTVRRQPPLSADSPLDLKSWASRISQRATGLLENLTVLEIDPARKEAILRSSEPARRGDNVQYYELLLQAAGEATLRRFQANREGQGRREQIVFALTHEALAKLSADLVPAE
jgi:hypothetical protein